jgi:heme/copper-type cytochrome/quinol oxidase subunit 1
MFVLNPGGTAGSGGAPSAFQQKFWFFGKLGLYFVAIRCAFVFMASREEQKSLASSSSKQ